MTSSIENSMIYSSFNARALNPIEVAATFIPPPEFTKLTNGTHTLIVGPRGSGKTTLMKMLQQPAIESWEHVLAEQLRYETNFTGVFIPTDITFKSQLEAASEGIDGRDDLVRAAYSLHALSAMISAVEYRCGRRAIKVKYPVRRVDFTDQNEREFIANISHTLERRPRTNSFSSFRADIAKWQNEIFELAKQLRLNEAHVQRERIGSSGLLRLDIIRTIKIVIDAFESESKLYGERWALLWDELEIAPKIIVDDLFRLLRSTDDRLLFKLSLSPCTAESPQVSDGFVMAKDSHASRGGRKPDVGTLPREQEDFDVIRLWFPHKRDGFNFARQLTQSVIAAKGYGSQSIDDILGPSIFDSPDASSSKAGAVYAPGSSHNKRMKRLADKDPSFAKYLRDKQIDLNTRIQSDDERAKTLRKINGIVVVREAFKGANGSRTRKNPTLYTGASAFLSICESNPRLLIGLLNQLLPNSDQTQTTKTSDSKYKIAPNKQAQVFNSAMARFRAYLRTIPLDPIGVRRPRGLLSLVDDIGEYFYGEVVGDDFDDDPDITFFVDSRVQPALRDAIQRALNAGALIWVPDKSDGSLLTSLNGKRFRLSYLLAPMNRLPLQLGRPISLHRILDRSTNSKADEPTPYLFDLSEEEL